MTHLSAYCALRSSGRVAELRDAIATRAPSHVEGMSVADDAKPITQSRRVHTAPQHKWVRYVGVKTGAVRTLIIYAGMGRSSVRANPRASRSTSGPPWSTTSDAT